MNKKFLLLTFCIVILVGCDVINKQPSIKEISTPSDKVQQGEQFKLFITIKNPTQIEYKPYIMLQYDKTVFSYSSSYYYDFNKKLPLEPIKGGDEKSYLLQFTVQREIESGPYPITIYLYGDETAIQTLSSSEKQINVVSSVTQ